MVSLALALTLKHNHKLLTGMPGMRRFGWWRVARKCPLIGRASLCPFLSISGICVLSTKRTVFDTHYGRVMNGIDRRRAALTSTHARIVRNTLMLLRWICLNRSRRLYTASILRALRPGDRDRELVDSRMSFLTPFRHDSHQSLYRHGLNHVAYGTRRSRSRWRVRLLF